MRTYDAIIVGAGIVGAGVAYQLKKRGAKKVLLLDRGKPASGGTGKSAAIVRQHYSTTLMARLALASMRMFETMHEELSVDGVFDQTGWLMLVPEHLMAAADKNLADQRSVGVSTDWVARSEWATRFPWLDSDGIAGVVYEPLGGHADPIRVTEALVANFQRLGGDVRFKEPCRALLREKDSVTGVLLDDGVLHAGAVVNAAGPWARMLAETVALDLPLRSVREQDTIWEARPSAPIPSTPVSNAVDAIYSVPQGGSRMLIGQGFPKPYFDVDPYNYKETGDDDFISDTQGRAERRYPTLRGMKLISAYAALYDVTPDWYPFIGPRTGISGYYDASGGSGHGFKIAPAIASEMADWILSGEVKSDFARLSHDRIAQNALFVGSYGGNRG